MYRAEFKKMIRNELKNFKWENYTSVDEFFSDLEDSIRLEAEFNIKIARKEGFVQIEEDYCPSSDTTYLMKHTYVKGELREREIIGFYSGEPDKEATEAYTACGGIKATYIL